MDPYEFLKIIINPDGTISRHLEFPDSSPSPTTGPVLSKDIPVNPSITTWLRIYLPQPQPQPGHHYKDKTKLPLIFYIHGGGFVYMSASSTLVHDFCADMALELQAVVVSPEYRLTPEHRLPAAYDDAMEALHWTAASDDPWLKDFADCDNCFLMGTSAGANIAYHVGLRAAAAAAAAATAADEVNVHPPLPLLKIQGLILHHPFFGGVRRCGSEIRLENDPHLPPLVCDVLWDLSLPSGADRDHEFCNPTAGGGSKLLDHVGLLGWRTLILGCDGDPLIDRQMELAKLMQDKGLKVATHFTEGDYHGVEIVEPPKAKPLHLVLNNFLSA
ncbi:hypothetical protein Tsubulata_024441 [Turnera subulata]|uniref:Alpha/beta hydrolase fold-3 domain-containing protein n=1 Tax=Turnera subulata TaxID=218843 RepID=A0A9Q0F8Z5_9ROSI|nr:hypothetical protein Tsubulata_024441 [Turnera subulata]